MFHFTLFIKDVLQTFGEPLHLLTVHLKSFFRGALEKNIVVPENRHYSTQYFAKSLP